MVTDQRRPIFNSNAARTTPGNIIRECKSTHPFEIRAIVLLPEHLHTISKTMLDKVTLKFD